ncbi:MAG TPA: hypothetical protein VIY68_17980 [Steroidobacteraceae bacterium]
MLSPQRCCLHLRTQFKGPLAIFSPHSADAIVAGDYWQDAGVMQMTGLAPTVSCEEAVSLKQRTAGEFEGRETQVASLPSELTEQQLNDIFFAEPPCTSTSERANESGQAAIAAGL